MASGQSYLSPAASDLGLGDALTSQVKDETEEERKRRIKEAQARQTMGPAATALGLSPTAGLLGAR